MVMRKAVPIVLVMLLLLCGSAMAKDETIAVLSELQGEALLFQGDRYLPVEKGRRLKEGDRLMIMEDSKVRIIFDNDCDISWEGAKIIDIHADSCNKLAALWKPCLSTAGKAADSEDIILSQLLGSALVRRNGKYLAATEGQVLQEGDELKLDGAAEINYQGTCVTTHKGKVSLKISRDACPVAQVRKVEGEVMIDQGNGMVPAVAGDKLKDGWKLEIPRNSRIEVVYFNGCDEAWDGHKVVAIDAASCPAGAVTPVNCTPAVFGNMTLGDIGVIGSTGVVFSLPPKNPSPNNPPPPISP
ncbi:hypothetical protein [Thiolapillus sp.]